jgi:hypothetical protein
MATPTAAGPRDPATKIARWLLRQCDHDLDLLARERFGIDLDSLLEAADASATGRPGTPRLAAERLGVTVRTVSRRYRALGSAGPTGALRVLVAELEPAFAALIT